jgi:hypothetical protein
MQIINVIKEIKQDIKLAKSESKQAMKYMKNPEMPQQIAWLDETILNIDKNYDDLLDIDINKGDKERLIMDINTCYEYLDHVYENLHFKFAIWSFLIDIEGIEMMNYIDAKAKFFDEKSETFKNIKY